MGKLFLSKKSAVKKTGFCFFLICAFVCGGISAEETPPVFSWDLLWAGNWNGGNKEPGEKNYAAEELVSHGTLFNRGDLRLNFPRQTLSLRFAALDRRRLPEDARPDFSESVFHPGFGFYYAGGGAAGKILGGARLLRGVLEEQGLSARLRNTWLKSVPFTENRKPFTVDLQNTFSSSKSAETCLFLESPRIGYFSGYAASVFNDELNPAVSGGVEARWSGTGSLRLDAFYTQKELEARKAASWFSPAPPLPERDFRFRALGTALNTENFGISFDGAFSETFAYGSGLYTGAGLRLGSKPWKFSLAADGASARYTDSGGAAIGESFRTAARIERRWIRSGFFRGALLLRSPAAAEDFNRADLSIYFRPSSPPPRQMPFWRFTRASLGVKRDGRNIEEALDSVETAAGFNFGPVRSVFSLDLCFNSNLEEGKAPLIFQPGFENFESYRIAGELGWGTGVFDLRGKLGFKSEAEKENTWDFSIASSIRPTRNTRFSLKIASPDLPEKWNYTLSWRLEF